MLHTRKQYAGRCVICQNTTGWVTAPNKEELVPILKRAGWFPNGKELYCNLDAPDRLRDSIFLEGILFEFTQRPIPVTVKMTTIGRGREVLGELTKYPTGWMFLIEHHTMYPRLARQDEYFKSREDAAKALFQAYKSQQRAGWVQQTAAQSQERVEVNKMVFSK